MFDEIKATVKGLAIATLVIVTTTVGLGAVVGTMVALFKLGFTTTINLFS